MKESVVQVEGEKGKMKKNLLVAQSGGPTAVINASLSGVIREALRQEKIEEVYGARYGIEGVFREDFLNLGKIVKEQQEALFSGKSMDYTGLSSLAKEIYQGEGAEEEEALRLRFAAYFARLATTPSSALGSCRKKLQNPEENPADFEELLRIFKKWNIGYFLYIGGNDSMDTAWKLSLYFKRIGEDIQVIGVPKTIDNDLCGIDHCPGFASSVKYLSSCLLELEEECRVYDKNYVMIVEMMGRNAGWLTAAAALSAERGSIPYLIYVEESTFSKEKFLSDIEETLKEHPHIMVAVSEGVKDESGRFLYTYGKEEGEKDSFGHSIAGGTGAVLEGFLHEAAESEAMRYPIIKEKKVKTRAIEFNLLQRCASHSLSKTDVLEAFSLGESAVLLALSEESGKMASLKRVNGIDGEYLVKFISAPLEEVANKEKKLPKEWISENGHGLKEECLLYLRPLILGECSAEYEDGLPAYIRLF